MYHQQHPQRTKAWITNSRWYLESELPVSFDRICFLLPSHRTVFVDIQARNIFMHIFLRFLNLKHNLKIKIEHRISSGQGIQQKHKHRPIIGALTVEPSGSKISAPTARHSS